MDDFIFAYRFGSHCQKEAQGQLFPGLGQEFFEMCFEMCSSLLHTRVDPALVCISAVKLRVPRDQV